MKGIFDLILLEPHENGIQSLLTQGGGAERSAYMLFGQSKIQTDPWSKSPRTRLISHKFLDLNPTDLISSSERHVTWQTDGFMKLLGDAMINNLVPAIVHTHPKGIAEFSKQDDKNEAMLARTVLLKGAVGLISIVISGDGKIAARIWLSKDKPTNFKRILHTGSRLKLICEDDADIGFLDRQTRLFGKYTTQMLTKFRCGIVGGGATGSAVLQLLLRLGIREAIMFEKDHVEETNLNRLHGARYNDVDLAPVNRSKFM